MPGRKSKSQAGKPQGTDQENWAAKRAVLPHGVREEWILSPDVAGQAGTDPKADVESSQEAAMARGRRQMGTLNSVF